MRRNATTVAPLTRSSGNNENMRGMVENMYMNQAAFSATVSDGLVGRGWFA